MLPEKVLGYGQKGTYYHTIPHMKVTTGNSSPVSSTTKTPRAARLWGFLYAQKWEFSLIFSLIALSDGNRLYELLHAAGALPAHLSGDMTVNIQCKRRCSVAQVFLEGLDIVPAFYCGNRVRVPLWHNNNMRAGNP